MSVSKNLSGIRRRGLRFGGTLFLLALMLSATNSPVLAQSESAESHHGQVSSIEGSWICSINRTTQGVVFTALMSFTEGGVALATGSIDRLPPPPISPIYGSWKRVGHNRVHVTIYFFIFDPLGNAVGTIKNNEILRLEGQDHISGSGVAFICDVQGENCKNLGSPISITGKRVIPEGVLE